MEEEAFWVEEGGGRVKLPSRRTGKVKGLGVYSVIKDPLEVCGHTFKMKAISTNVLFSSGHIQLHRCDTG